MWSTSSVAQLSNRNMSEQLNVRMKRKKHVTLSHHTLHSHWSAYCDTHTHRARCLSASQHFTSECPWARHQIWETIQQHTESTLNPNQLSLSESKQTNLFTVRPASSHEINITHFITPAGNDVTWPSRDLRCLTDVTDGLESDSVRFKKDTVWFKENILFGFKSVNDATDS